jgi:hypothetical protein
MNQESSLVRVPHAKEDSHDKQSLFLGKRESRRWDEVQSASVGFASANSWVWGGFATILLLMVPPVMNWLVDLVNAVVQRAGHGSPDMTNHLAVRLRRTVMTCERMSP